MYKWYIYSHISYRYRNWNVDLSMDKGWHCHFWSDLCNLYHCEHDERKRWDLRGGCNQLGEFSDFSVGDLDGERGTRGTDDHDAARGAVGDGWTISIVYSGGDGLRHVDVSMDEGRHQHFRSDCAHLYDREHCER